MNAFFNFKLLGDGLMFHLYQLELGIIIFNMLSPFIKLYQLHGCCPSFLFHINFSLLNFFTRAPRIKFVLFGYLVILFRQSCFEFSFVLPLTRVQRRKHVVNVGVSDSSSLSIPFPFLPCRSLFRRVTRNSGRRISRRTC